MAADSTHPAEMPASADAQTDAVAAALALADRHRELLAREGEECTPQLTTRLLGELAPLFARWQESPGVFARASAADLQHLNEALKENLRRIGEKRIRDCTAGGLATASRMAWLAATSELGASPVEQLGWHPARGTRRVAFYTSGPFPPAGTRVDDGAVRVLERKRRAIDFFGTTWVYQHLFVLPHEPGSQPRFSCEADFIFENDGAVRMCEEYAQTMDPVKAPRPPRGWALRRRLGRRLWLFVVDESSDCGQSLALQRYSARHMRWTDTRFVLAPGSRHATAVRAQGGHIVHAGSAEHRALLRLAEAVFTTTLDPHWTGPMSSAATGGSPEPTAHGGPRIVLLPGSELSLLATRDERLAAADLIPVSSAIEHERVSGHYGPSPVLPSAARLTGLPLHDLLLTARTAPHTLVLAPAWPSAPEHPSSADMAEHARLNAATAARWQALLALPELRQLAPRLVLLLPDGAPREPFSNAGVELAVSPLQRVAALGACAAVLTDYDAATALDAAVVGRATVYLQSDPAARFGAPDSLLSAEHAFREQGFGPVVETPEAAVAELARVIEELPSHYARRIELAVAHRDGRAAERLVEELR